MISFLLATLIRFVLAAHNGIYSPQGINDALKNTIFTFKVRVEDYMKGKNTRANMWGQSSPRDPGRLVFRGKGPTPLVQRPGARVGGEG